MPSVNRTLDDCYGSDASGTVRDLPPVAVVADLDLDWQIAGRVKYFLTALATSQPPPSDIMNMGIELDGWTECWLSPDARAKIQSTPRYPQLVTRPPKVKYQITEAEIKGLECLQQRISEGASLSVVKGLY